jgi:hypothetical protein
MSVLTPMLVLGGVSYANNWYNNPTTGLTDLKPLLFAGVSAIFLEMFAAIPGMEPTATALGWLAVVGMFLSPVQNPSPVENLLSIGQSTTKKK